MTSSVFVTGGTGFVGKGVLEALALDPDQPRVRALARSRTNGDLVAALGAEPVMGDILEPESLRAGMEGCDVVYHVAGHNAMCERDPAPMFAVNVTGTSNVMAAAAAAGVRRVVLTSSAAALGHRAGTVGDEESPHRGWFLSRYEESKYEGEQVARAASERLGVELVVVNPSSVQGPGRSTGSARLFLAYLNGQLRVASDTTVGICDVADCAAGHLLAAKRGEPGRRYVLNGSSHTLRSLVDLIASIAGVRRRVLWLPGFSMLPMGWLGSAAQALGRHPPICREMVRTLLHGHHYDGSRVQRELGLDYLPIGATLRRTIEWYAEVGFISAPATGGEG